MNEQSARNYVNIINQMARTLYNQSEDAYDAQAENDAQAAEASWKLFEATRKDLLEYLANFEPHHDFS